MDCTQTSEESLPYTVEASFYDESTHPGQGLVYLTLRANDKSSYVWNNLASPPQISLKPVSGVVLHTGLGRAVLPKDTQDAIDAVIEGYCTLAADVETGRRGHRDVHLDDHDLFPVARCF